ncbi:MAG: hypothetical protein LUI14_06950, partial [Lachnospiraceae bacterium]|nr:hypothetical protein [Lachnospiraceae bacterium]
RADSGLAPVRNVRRRAHVEERPVHEMCTGLFYAQGRNDRLLLDHALAIFFLFRNIRNDWAVENLARIDINAAIFIPVATDIPRNRTIQHRQFVAKNLLFFQHFKNTAAFYQWFHIELSDAAIIHISIHNEIFSGNSLKYFRRKMLKIKFTVFHVITASLHQWINPV